jgi:hypothetical protein
MDLIYLIRNARNLPGSIGAKERAVLYALASRMNPERDGQYVCKPGVETIALDTSQSKRNVDRALDALITAKLIVRQDRKDTSSLTWIDVKTLLSYQPATESEDEDLPPSPVEVVTKPGKVDPVVTKPALQQPKPHSALAAEIRKMKHIGGALSDKDVEYVVSGLKKHGEISRLLAIATLDESIVVRACKADNKAAYLLKCLTQKIEELEAKEKEETKEYPDIEKFTREVTDKVNAGNAESMTSTFDCDPTASAALIDSLRSEVEVGESFINWATAEIVTPLKARKAAA